MTTPSLSRQAMLRALADLGDQTFSFDPRVHQACRGWAAARDRETRLVLAPPGGGLTWLGEQMIQEDQADVIPLPDLDAPSTDGATDDDLQRLWARTILQNRGPSVSEGASWFVLDSMARALGENHPERISFVGALREITPLAPAFRHRVIAALLTLVARWIDVAPRLVVKVLLSDASVLNPAEGALPAQDPPLLHALLDRSVTLTWTEEDVVLLALRHLALAGRPVRDWLRSWGVILAPKEADEGSAEAAEATPPGGWTPILPGDPGTWLCRLVRHPPVQTARKSPPGKHLLHRLRDAHGRSLPGHLLAFFRAAAGQQLADEEKWAIPDEALTSAPIVLGDVRPLAQVGTAWVGRLLLHEPASLPSLAAFRGAAFPISTTAALERIHLHQKTSADMGPEGAALAPIEVLTGLLHLGVFSASKEKEEIHAGDLILHALAATRRAGHPHAALSKEHAPCVHRPAARERQLPPAASAPQEAPPDGDPHASQVRSFRFTDDDCRIVKAIIAQEVDRVRAEGGIAKALSFSEVLQNLVRAEAERRGITVSAPEVRSARRGPLLMNQMALEDGRTGEIDEAALAMFGQPS